MLWVAAAATWCRYAKVSVWFWTRVAMSSHVEAQRLRAGEDGLVSARRGGAENEPLDAVRVAQHELLGHHPAE